MRARNEWKQMLHKLGFFFITSLGDTLSFPVWFLHRKFTRIKANNTHRQCWRSIHYERSRKQRAYFIRNSVVRQRKTWLLNNVTYSQKDKRTTNREKKNIIQFFIFLSILQWQRVEHIHTSVGFIFISKCLQLLKIIRVWAGGCVCVQIKRANKRAHLSFH